MGLCVVFYIICVVFVLLYFPAKDFSPSQGCRCGHLPSQVFVVSSSNPPSCRWPVGGSLHYFSLTLAPLFPSMSTRARLAMVPFLWLVCRRDFSCPPPPHRWYATGSRAFPASPRHTGGTRQIFDEWLLPCGRVCVSFNCFSSRVPGSLVRPLEVWEWDLRSLIFDSWSSS